MGREGVPFRVLFSLGYCSFTIEILLSIKCSPSYIILTLLFWKVKEDFGIPARGYIRWRDEIASQTAPCPKRHE